MQDLVEVPHNEVEKEDGYEKLLSIYKAEQQRLAAGEELRPTVMAFFQESGDGKVLKKDDPKYLINRDDIIKGGENSFLFMRRGYSDLGVPIVAKIVNKSVDPGSEIALAAEAKKTGRLQHPNIITAYDFLAHQKWGDVDISMLILREAELGRISKLREDQPISPSEFFKVVNDLGVALDYLHSQGKDHADLYERNVLLNENNEVKIIDFEDYSYDGDDVDGYLGIVYGLLTGRRQPDSVEFLEFSELKYEQVKDELNSRSLIREMKMWNDFLDLCKDYKSHKMKVGEVHRRLTEIFSGMK